MSELSENIYRLREQGKTYNQIAEELRCSKGTISYYLGQGQKQKTADRQIKRRDTLEGALKSRIAGFHEDRPKNPIDPAERIRSVARRNSDKVTNYCRPLYGGGIRNNYSFSFEDVVLKFGDNSVCYLTGDPVDLADPSSYEFDHITPRSRGGSNELTNLGLTTKEANRLKGSLTVEELLEVCEKVLIHYGKTVS